MNRYDSRMRTAIPFDAGLITMNRLMVAAILFAAAGLVLALIEEARRG